jgi:hypothetical protein
MRVGRSVTSTGVRAGTGATRAGIAAARTGLQAGAAATTAPVWKWVALILVALLVLYAFLAINVNIMRSQANDALDALKNLTASPPQGSGIPEVYWPMHISAAEYYEINPYLLASIHQVESGFSTHPSLLGGWNVCKAAGPMQFGVVGVAPYNAPSGGCSAGGTWDAHKFAFRPIATARPASSYPLDRRRLVSCRAVPPDTGCVYDDFDAIAGAAHKLKSDGADMDLRSAGTRQAVLRYNRSNKYADGVINQAVGWQRMGAAQRPSGPISGGAKGIVERAVAIAEPSGTWVASAHRPGDFGSDHSRNDAFMAARDIAVRGINALFGPPSPRLDEAVVKIGAQFGRTYRPGVMIVDTFPWKEFRIQIIWRTPLYGGHMGHIHIGARRETDRGV